MVELRSTLDRYLDGLRGSIGSPREASVIVAAMLVWARLLPNTLGTSLESGGFGFFDDQKELTVRGWMDVVEALRRFRSDKGDAWAFDEVDTVLVMKLPGTLESLRQQLRAHLAASNDSIIDCSRAWARPLMHRVTEEQESLTDLIVHSLHSEGGATVYCGFDLSAPAALELAISNRVYLQLANVELARLAALLGIAGDYAIEVSPTPPVYGDEPEPQTPPWMDGNKIRPFDYAIALPPFGVRYPVKSFDQSTRGSFTSSSTADALHISLALGRGFKRRIVLLPDGLLFRTTKADQAYKRSLISRWGLSKVISLPRGVIGEGRGVASSLLVFEVVGQDQPGVQFVDVKSGWPDRPRPANVKSRATQFQALASAIDDEDPSLSARASMDEIIANDFNLLADRYVIAPELRKKRQLLARQELAALGDLVEFHRPQVITPSSVSDRPPIAQLIRMREVSTGDIRDGVVARPQKEIEIWSGDVDKIERWILSPGDILVSIKGKVGVVGVVPEHVPGDIFDAWIAGQSFVIARLRRTSKLRLRDPAVLVQYLTSSFGQSELRALAGGASVPLIQMADLKRLSVPLPSLETQNEILQNIQKIAKLREDILSIEQQIATAELELTELFISSDNKHA